MELSHPADCGYTLRPASLLSRLGLPPRTDRRRRQFERTSKCLTAARFLPKDESKWIIGESIHVVGGYGVAKIEYEEDDRVFAEVG